MKYVSLVLMLILFIACNKETNEKDETKNGIEIEGEYQWVRSIGGIAGEELTPISTGINQSLSVLQDSISFFRNGVLMSKNHYRIDLGRSIFSIDSIELIILDDGNQYGYEYDGQTLILIDDIYDGYSHEYKK